MRFICLHGLGSNSRIFEQQTAALRYELDAKHTYDFVEGNIQWEPTTKDLMGPEKAFAYCDPRKPSSCLQAGIDLDNYLAEYGPYDGIIGFSSGASLAISWLLRKQQVGDGTCILPVRLGVFFSAHQPLDSWALQSDQLREVDPMRMGKLLDLPTAHIWGSADPCQDNSRLAAECFNPETRHIFVHQSGHLVPTSPGEVVSMAKIINRVISAVPRD